LISGTMKSTLGTIGEIPRGRETSRGLFLDDVRVSATAQKILGKHSKPAGAVPVLFLLAESDFHDEAATNELRSARPAARAGLNVVVPGWLREAGADSEDSQQQETFTFGEITVNVPTMEVCRGGRIVRLRCKEFQLLMHLLKNPRRVISRDELLKDVWGYQSYPTTRTVDNHMLRLRQKLEAEPNQPKHFVTVHGVGYRFLS
jgi:DNA-binding response OmpR family regulator